MQGNLEKTYSRSDVLFDNTASYSLQSEEIAVTTYLTQHCRKNWCNILMEKTHRIFKTETRWFKKFVQNFSTNGNYSFDCM